MMDPKLCPVKSIVFPEEYVLHGNLRVILSFYPSELDVVSSDDEKDGIVERIRVYTFFDRRVRRLLREKPPKYAWQSRCFPNGGKIILANKSPIDELENNKKMEISDDVGVIEGIVLNGMRHLAKSQRHSERIGWRYDIGFPCESFVSYFRDPSLSLVREVV